MANNDAPKPKVLLLEDEEDIRELLSHLLKAYGCEPLLASTEKQIQDYLAQEKISLALLDICLPSVDGRLVAARLRNQGVTFPIYFMTGILDIRITEADRANVAGVLRKPFSIESLRQVLSSALGGIKRPPQDPGQTLLELAAMLATEQEALRRRQDDTFSRLSDLLSGTVMEELRANAKQADEILSRTVRELRSVHQDLAAAKK